MNVKFISAALLLGVAAAQECPGSIDLGAYKEVELMGTNLIFKHAIVLASNPNEESILCGRLEYVGEGYVALAVSPTGKMEDGEAIIGLPEANTVKKYDLKPSTQGGGVTEMPAEKQTLMFTDIVQEDGRTVMDFAKLLKEYDDSEHEIANGKNTFLWAVGNGNSLGYHKSKSAFDVTFDATLSPTPFRTNPPTSEVSISGTAGGSPGGSDSEGADPITGRTAPPVPVVDRLPPTPTQSPVVEAPAVPGEGSGDVPPPAPSPETPPTEPAPTPETPPTEPAPSPSGAVNRNIAGTMVLSVGVACLFGI